MNAQEQAEKNILIDVLFDQIEALDDVSLKDAEIAIALWMSAKTGSELDAMRTNAISLSMEARSEYETAYDALSNLGLEVGGMIKPDPDNRGMLYH